MERFRRKKSKAPVVNEGSQQIHRERNSQILSSDSSSFGSSAIKEHSMACELDRSSSRRGSGLPIKKLLAEEMSKETEANRRSPSVVARLMGFDGLPSQHLIHTEHKASKQRTTSNISGMRRNPYECQSERKISKEYPEFKDVYEVSEAKKCVKPHSELAMSFIHEKFMDAKRLSADNRFHNSKEFYDTLNALDTNKELLIEYLQQPDSLYTKHLHDLQGDFSMYVSRRPRPILEKCENKTKYSKSKKETARCNTRYRKEQLGSSNRSSELFEIQSKEQHVTENLQTRIVVLKPNLEKLQNAKKPVSLHSRHVKYPNNVKEGEKQLGVKPFPGDNGFSCPNMRESRERAKMITRRMRKNNGNKPIDMPSIFQGYAGDESSYSVSGSESGSELEETMLSSRKSFHWRNRRNAMSSFSPESSISREAKKRLSKRWNVSQKYQAVSSVGKVSKLGEMLNKPIREMRRDILDPMLVPDISRGRVYGDDIMVFGSPSGINCRENGKELHTRNVSKPSFVSDSFVICYSPETSSKYRTHSKEIKDNTLDSSCGSPDKFSVKPSPCLAGINNSSAPVPQYSKQQVEPAKKDLVPLQCSVPEIQSPESSKEADHPSPISVLKAPLVEDTPSSSECFERVSADLHELRMQLKLLRLESGADGDNLISSDKDDSRGYFSDIDENEISEYATWQTSYIDDTLKESGFDSTDTNMIVAIWHSLECPIGPLVFDELEKNYFKDKKTTKSDRKFLFDRINCGIAEIFWWLVDPHPWVETGRRKVELGLAKNGVRYELEKLLLSEENSTIEKMLDQEMEWRLDYGDEIDDIGRDIEDLLINDLMNELADMYAV